MNEDINKLLEKDPTNSNNKKEKIDKETPESEVKEQSVPNKVTEDQESEIGHIVTSETLKVGQNENEIRGFIRTDSRNKVRVGDYIEINYPENKEILFGSIKSLKYEPYTEIDDKNDSHHHISRNQDLNESDYPLIAELEPVSILEQQKAKLSRRSVDRVPKPNTTIRICRDEKKLRTGLNIPKNGIFVGFVSVGGKKQPRDPPLPYLLQNPGMDPEGNIEPGDPAIFRHILVSGSTGKGKTHFNKNLLRQFVNGKRYPINNLEDEKEKRKLGIVIIDPENEYSELASDNPNLENIEELKDLGIEVGGVKNLKSFIPSAGSTNDPKLKEFMKFTIPFSMVLERPELLMPYEPSPVTRGALEDLINSYFQKKQKHSYEGFLSYLEQNEEELKKTNSIADSTWDAVLRRIEKQVYHQVFDQGKKPFTEITNEIFRPGQVSVIPTSHLKGRKENIIVLSILSYIVENKIEDYEPDKNIKETPLLLSVDEAHNYLARAENIQEQYIIEKFREAAKQGRKDKLGLNMITQNPQDIDDQILKQTNTRILLGLSEEVVESIKVPKGFEKDIPLFKKGQAVVKAPDVEPVEILGLQKCVTKHSN